MFIYKNINDFVYIYPSLHEFSKNRGIKKDLLWTRRCTKRFDWLAGPEVA